MYTHNLTTAIQTKTAVSKQISEKVTYILYSCWDLHIAETRSRKVTNNSRDTFMVRVASF